MSRLEFSNSLLLSCYPREIDREGGRKAQRSWLNNIWRLPRGCRINVVVFAQQFPACSSCAVGPFAEGGGRRLMSRVSPSPSFPSSPLPLVSRASFDAHHPWTRASFFAIRSSQGEFTWVKLKIGSREGWYDEFFDRSIGIGENNLFTREDEFVGSFCWLDLLELWWIEETIFQFGYVQVRVSFWEKK